MPWSKMRASESSWALLGCELPCLFPCTGSSQAQDSASYFGWSCHEGIFCMLEFLRVLIYVILATTCWNFSTILQLLFIHLTTWPALINQWGLLNADSGNLWRVMPSLSHLNMLWTLLPCPEAPSPPQKTPYLPCLTFLKVFARTVHWVKHLWPK